MNDMFIENAQPSNASTPNRAAVELTSLDPIHEVYVLRELNRRWQRMAVGSIAFAVFLFVVSIVQFLGTFTTCRLLDLGWGFARTRNPKYGFPLPEGSHP